MRRWAVEEILQLYPQVLYHSHYQGRDFTRAQIVWLKIECPYDGSTKGLCVNFFQAIDGLIGTNYEENFATGRRTLDEMMPNMARVASIHGIGVLVIDDIQFLSQAKSGGSSRMLNFFTYLVNTAGVPVLLISTYKARRILTGNLPESSSEQRGIEVNSELLETYRNQWLETIRENPGTGRYELGKRAGRAYYWLLARDREWFEANSPPRIKSPGPPKLTDWEKRDAELVVEEGYRIQDDERAGKASKGFSNRYREIPWGSRNDL